MTSPVTLHPEELLSQKSEEWEMPLDCELAPFQITKDNLRLLLIDHVTK
jgi:hypothetical protein